MIGDDNSSSAGYGNVTYEVILCGDKVGSDGDGIDNDHIDAVIVFFHVLTNRPFWAETVSAMEPAPAETPHHQCLQWQLVRLRHRSKQSVRHHLKKIIN